MSESEVNISVQSAAELLNDDNVVFLDCRTEKERQFANFNDDSLFIPIDELGKRSAELDAYRNHQMIVYCHLGGRSAMVVEWLRDNGFPRAQNMIGGIDQWSLEIDNAIPRYQ